MKHHFKFAFVVCCAMVVLLQNSRAATVQAAIEAEVTGVDGRPSKAAEVRIERQDKKSAPIVMKTDKRGHLVATNLPAGVYTLTATVEGGIQSSQVIKTQANKSLLVAFDMRKTPAMASKTKQRYIWVQAQTGSRIGGYWVKADDNNTQTARANGQNVDTMDGRAFDDSHIRMSAPQPGSR